MAGGRADGYWGEGGWITLWDTCSYVELDTWECQQFGPCNAIKPLSWVSASSRPALQEASSTSKSPTLSKMDSSGPGACPSELNWRLLTGHENGQLLLWHPGLDKLTPLLKIGDPGSAIRYASTPPLSTGCSFYRACMSILISVPVFGISHP